MQGIKRAWLQLNPLETTMSLKRKGFKLILSFINTLTIISYQFNQLPLNFFVVSRFTTKLVFSFKQATEWKEQFVTHFQYFRIEPHCGHVRLRKYCFVVRASSAEGYEAAGRVQILIEPPSSQAPFWNIKYVCEPCTYILAYLSFAY